MFKNKTILLTIKPCNSLPSQGPESSVRLSDVSRSVDSENSRYNADLYNDTIVLPSKDVISRMSHEDLGSLYHRFVQYVTSLQVLCRRVTRVGQLDDGGWEICDDHHYKPSVNCLVYSFGIKDDFSFDDEMGKQYGCEVHSFDPSNGLKDHKRSEKVTFHSYGISNDNKDFVSGKGTRWKMKNLNSFKEFLGHSSKQLDVLKMDVETWEWRILPEMISTGSLQNVRQFLAEFHIAISPKEPSKEKYKMALYIFKDLYDLGFRIFWTHRNLWCKFTSHDGIKRSGCHEISFLQV
ncbi:hypothetical protein KUTeg_014738 [Tegillarca granosa]|uniref:Methyltransferase domain-containing protein n=1 Tax=Tegillarca granosa TaxID=220873 RepID=A0ABQ9EVV5_TEGGR|nr:hypothetical protein KUTeg_014738 [Tegillarca granosa]